MLVLVSVKNYANIDVDTIVIRFMTWNVDDAPHLITCINFETEVPYCEYIVSDMSKITSLDDKLHNLRATKNLDFCVGCKLLYIKKGVVKNVICLNNKYVMENGIVYFCNDSLINMIDSLTKSITASAKKFNYMPELYGEEFSKGKKELHKILSSYYDKLRKKYNVHGTTRLEIFCKANKKGKTTVANTRLYNKEINTEYIVKIEKLFNRFFLKKIRWKKNSTRMNADWIKVYYKSANE